MLRIGVVLGIAFIVSTSSADVLVVQGGQIWIGEVEREKDSYRIHTGGVVLEFRVGEVLEFRPGLGEDDLFDEALAKRRPEVPDAWLLLAREFESRGLSSLARRALDQCLSVDPDHELARAALGEFKSGSGWKPIEEYLTELGFVQEHGRWSLAREGAPPGPPADSGAFGDLQRAYRESTDPSQRATLFARRREVVQTLVESLHESPDPFRRESAARELGASGELVAIRPLVRSAVADPEAKVRDAATEGLLEIGYAETPAAFEVALIHEDPAIRVNAIRAVARFANFPALRTLVRTIHVRHPGGPRANIFVGTQTAYIRDFDVQVAQGAAVADPIVGVVTDGVVLDAKVLWIDEFITIEERQALFGSLRQLAGVELPDRPEAWLVWWAENGPALEGEYRRG